ncbi:MAG TPA: type II toxin-antitoxin system VapC family toxin [Candidatus Acidoferrales bacterium]|nr:type II toxin-antitoxin system VapC family toxin [Candidatus Acidoferrales bacterium]
MRLLLDTHIWLWSLAEPKRLSRRVQHELRDANNELWLSPVSTWEALLLHANGRIRLQDDLQDWVVNATAHFREAPLTHEIVVAAHELPLPDQDPADRLLTATAGTLGLTLVTADDRLLGLGKIATLANR